MRYVFVRFITFFGNCADLLCNPSQCKLTTFGCLLLQGLALLNQLGLTKPLIKAMQVLHMHAYSLNLSPLTFSSPQL